MSSSVQRWLRPVLDRIDGNSRSLSTPEGNVVDMPNGLGRLHKAILHQQTLLDEVREEREAYDEAWRAAQMDIQAAYEKNSVKTKQIESTLYKLRSEWMTATEPLGIEAQIRRPELPITAENEP